MKHLILVTLLLLISGLFGRTEAMLLQSNDSQRRLGELKFEPYKFQFDGQTIDAELGRLTVKENRRSEKSNLIELVFVRLKSTSAQPGFPVVYLDGGPGSSAINIARVPEYARAFLKLREVGDVILLDQRGVGRSRSLARLSVEALPADAFASQEVAFRALRDRTKSAADYFRSQGVDIQAYNTVESADDVEDLRKALGAAKINLMGFSYGTHLGLAVIRQHGASLNRVALIGTEGQNHTRKLPGSADKSFERLAKLAAQDSTVGSKLPDLVGTLKNILAKLEKEPITLTINDQKTRKPIEVKVGKFGLQLILMRDLGDTNDLPFFPAMIYTIDKGDYSMLKRLVERRFNEYGAGVSLMTFMMDAASGATRQRDEQIAREAKTALLGNVMNFPFPEIGEVLGKPDLGDQFRSPIKTSVPTLFISGSLDNNTPPFQADEVRRTFKRSTHLIVENAGHESMLTEESVQQVLVDYLLGRDVSKAKLALPPLRFRPIPEIKSETKL